MPSNPGDLPEAKLLIDKEFFSQVIVFFVVGDLNHCLDIDFLKCSGVILLMESSAIFCAEQLVG
jgi:hypothetical protein